MAIDVEGNCRFYDLLRFKKMAKITPFVVRGDENRDHSHSFRVLN
jgi:hypothetical protein